MALLMAANWLSELADELEQKIINSLAGVVGHALNASQELLAMGMNNNAAAPSSTSNASNGLFANFLTHHPSEFDATLTGSHGGEMWNDMENLCNSAVVPIAGLIMVVILLNDLLQMIMEGNNFRDFDISILFKWIFKAVCGIILISNVYYITSGFLSFGTSATNSAINAIFHLNGTYMTGSTITIDPTGLGIPELLLDLILAGFLLLIVGALLVVMIIVLASRMIEIFMYLTAAPLPVATMMNRDWGEIGKNWIRNMVALGFQGFFIVVALSIFQTIFSAVVSTLNTSTDTLTWQLLLLMGYALALCFTILKSGSISKSVFNAH